ncbi:Flp pilus assembly pilin Flp [Rubricella aquisinus]|uniref:Flp pilus assembly pilin Flp n=1 Tax=Rubricella aquisinus TaxID=2028108 RepID=A0A840X5E9_9RHOB|nr:pilus assembly protein [Rubricella aquisinus]MBB5515927.1 Flp pilus assembly pilin Flp [Rubricella aquisinus]
MLKKFKNDESGAVTVDWVVLCGAVVAVAVGVVAALDTGLTTASTNITTNLDALGLGTTGDTEAAGAGDGG